MSQTTKTCTKCGQTKTLGEFYSDGRGGKRSECKTCTKYARQEAGREGAREAEARYRQRHRAELTERQKAWRRAHPERWRAINTKAVKRWRRANPAASRERNRRAYLARRARQRQEADT